MRGRRRHGRDWGKTQPPIPPKRREENDQQGSQLHLRTIADTLPARADHGVALPLPRLSAADRQSVWHRGLLRRRRDRYPGPIEDIPTPFRQRLPDQLPFLRSVRVDCVLVSVTKTGGGRRGRRLFRRSVLPGADKVSLRQAPPRLGRGARLTPKPASWATTRPRRLSPRDSSPSNRPAPAATAYGAAAPWSRSSASGRRGRGSP